MPYDVELRERRANLKRRIANLETSLEHLGNSLAPRSLEAQARIAAEYARLEQMNAELRAELLTVQTLLSDPRKHARQALPEAPGATERA